MLAWHLPNNLLYFHRPKDDLIHLFLSGVARRVAMTLLAIFSPIYIYLAIKNLGFSQPYAALSVLFYFLIVFIAKLVTLIYSEDLSRRIGFKGTIRISIVPFALFIPALIYASDYPILFLLTSILWGLHSGFFWWGYHGYFIKTGEKDHFGRSIGEANFLETVAAVLTPLLGSVVTNYLGFSVLFVLVALFMVISLLLLGKSREKRQKHDIQFKGVIKLIKVHKSVALAYIGAAGEAILYAVVWPIFLFLFFGKLVSLGIVVSLSALLAAIFATVIGGWADKQGERKIVSIGSLLLSISWLARVFSRSFQAFVAADTFRNFGQRMVNVPLNALSYKKALEAESAKAILFFETTSIVGIFISLIFLSIWMYLGGDLAGSFVLASLFSLLPLVAVFKKRLRDSNE